MIAGVGDDDISREGLNTEDILSRSSFDIISFIEKVKKWAAIQLRFRDLYLQSLSFNIRRRDILT